MDKEPSQISEQELESVSGGSIEKVLPKMMDELNHHIEEHLKLQTDTYIRIVDTLKQANRK